MAVLLDFNGVAVAGIAASVKANEKIEEGLVRHYILNSIRASRSKNIHEYGEVIVACDGDKIWRKDYFPYYKANRKTQKEKASIDWHGLIQAMNVIRDELRDIFPYGFVHTSGAEGDDAIKVLAEHLPGKHLIVTSDKDLVQLVSDRVHIWSPKAQNYIKEVPNQKRLLLEHILGGDVSDGVPNVLSDDDTFINPDKRQKPLRKLRKEELLVNIENENEELRRNFCRNKTLIDLAEIPENIKTKIIESYIEADSTRRRHLLNFFIEKELVNLTSFLGDF